MPGQSPDLHPSRGEKRLQQCSPTLERVLGACSARARRVLGAAL
jgi:hypothetical protein